MRQGDSNRDIAAARVMGRPKAAQWRRIATERGWLGPADPEPSLNSARATGGLERKLAALAKVPLPIVDDFGLKPLRALADKALHHLFAKRYEQAATIVTSDLHFPEGDQAFPATVC